MKQKISNLKAWLLDPKNKIFTLCMIGLLSVIIATNLMPQPTSAPTESQESADTYIPEGYVLVPIEIQNIDSLSSLIGSFAVVDLFSGIPGSSQQKVGQKLKLLRAPLNPQQFAVLVPEDKVSQLLQQPGPYWAAIQNPNQNSKENIQRKAIKQTRVEYYVGE